MSFWWLDPFTIMKWCLFLYFIEIHLILIWPLQLFDWHNDSISSFFFFNLLGLYIESMLVISGIQLCLIQSGVLCCLIGIFRPFTFNVIIDVIMFKTLTLFIYFPFVHTLFFFSCLLLAQLDFFVLLFCNFFWILGITCYFSDPKLL